MKAMHNIERRVYYVTFLIVCSAILINCQGGGGGGGHSGGGSRFRSSNNNNHGKSNCVGSECWKLFAIIMGILSAIGGSILFCCCYYHKRKGRPRKNNTTFVNSVPHQQYTPVKNAFQTGMWSSRYCQHKTCHGPYQLHLSFNPHSMTVNGSGSDDVGEFTIDGIFSDRTQRMGLTKYYKQETGDAAENLGHSVTIQVVWKAEQNQFEGKWYVQTKKYHGEDEFVLNLIESIV